MRTSCYPTDLTDDQWALVEPLLPMAKPGGRPRSTDLRAAVDGCLYRTKAGCQWRMLPADFPPWSTVHTYYRAWRLDGTWQAVHDALVPQVRAKAGRAPTPATAYLDSQSVKAAGAGGKVGYDAGKKVSGRKRHVIVDSLGLLLVAFVTAASVSDPTGAEDALALLPLDRLPRLKRIWADAAYGARRVAEAVAFWGRYVLEVVRRPEGATGWVLLPKRWVVERTFAWLGRYRLLNREYERSTDSSETNLYLAMTHLMLQRLYPRRRKRSQRFRYKPAG
jgi:putative transposase